MKWRPMKEITESELFPVIKDIFDAEEFTIINKEDDEIEIEVVTIWDGVHCDDTVILGNHSVDAVDSYGLVLDDRVQYLWQQWLMAKGYHSSYKLLRDNKYIDD